MLDPSKNRSSWSKNRMDVDLKIHHPQHPVARIRTIRTFRSKNSVLRIASDLNEASKNSLILV